MTHDIMENSFIFASEQKEIINIEYDTAHPFYYWYRYVVYLINAEESNIKKEIKDNVEKEIKELEKEEEIKRKNEEIKLLNNFKINESINFLFVLEEDAQDPAFYKALSFFLKQETNRKPLLSIGTFGLDNVITYLPVYYLDSSIWNRYINILYDFSIVRHPNFSVKLKNVIINIIKNNLQDLYNLIVAKEFIEFQVRMLENSYLGIPGGHAAAVVPFVFHSETNMVKGTEKIVSDIDKLLKTRFGKINIIWNVLLIDDYGEKNLKGSVTDNKKDIFQKVSNDLKGIINKDLKNYKFEFTTDVSENITDALDKIRKGTKQKIQFDIILLDYLLGRKTGENNIREYGDEFLNKLKNDKELLKKRSPLGKFWILPISSFSNAMLSKMEEEGIGRISENWYIMDGADMINTPQLFLYNFLKLIELQLKVAIVTREDIINFIMDNSSASDENSPKSEKGEKKEKENIYEVRQIARRLYGVFMHKFGLRDALKSDKEQGSAFAQSVLEYMYKERFEDLRFYENVRKLLYLVGFGTHNDAELMWDLLTFINTAVDSIKKDIDKKEQKNINSFLEVVAEYISELKKHNG